MKRVLLLAAAIIILSPIIAPALDPPEPRVESAPFTRPAPKEFFSLDDSPGGVHPEIPIRDVFFDKGSAKIRKDMQPVLDKNINWLKKNIRGVSFILLEGHTDERGKNEYNLMLGENRAMAVREHMIAAGVEDRWITVISYGEERPFALSYNEQSWKWNRRVHFLIKEY